MKTYWEKAEHAWSSDSLRYILTPSQKTQQMLLYIQEIGQFKAFDSYFTERANQKSYLMKYTINGSGRLVYQNKEYIVEKGDVFFIDCQNYQYYETIGSEPWEMSWVHLHGNALPYFYDEYNKDLCPVFHSNTLRIPQIMRHLIDLQSHHNARTNYLSSLLLHDLLNELIIQKNKLDFTRHEIPSYIVELRHYLDFHYHEKINLDLLEKLFMVNKYQLNKEFAKYIGTPPIDYLIHQRMNIAKELLRFSNDPIKVIADKIGIENTAYFSRLFKQKTGVSPNSYRKNW